MKFAEPPDRRSKTFKWIADAFAVALVAFVVWRMLVAPRFLAPPGRAMPALELSALDGSSYRLNAVPGRTTFLDFWASWCEPCRLSLPLVERYARAHPEVTVLAIDAGEPRPLVQAYARDHGLGDVAIDGRGSATAAFGVSAFPTLVVVDRNGFVRAKWSGFNPAISLAMANAERELALGSKASGR